MSEKYNQFAFLSVDEQIDIRNKISQINPKSEIQQRDKGILECYFVKGMTSTDIAKAKIFKGRKGYISARTVNNVVNKYFPNIFSKRKKEKSYYDKQVQKERNESTKIKNRWEQNICCRCGSSSKIELHHMIPVDLGGASCLENLMPLCEKCHNQYSLWYQQNKEEIIHKVIKLHAEYIVEMIRSDTKAEEKYFGEYNRKDA